MRESQYHILKDNKYIAICQQDYSGQDPEDMIDNVVFHSSVDNGLSGLILKIETIIASLEQFKDMNSVRRYVLQLQFILKDINRKVITTVDSINVDNSCFDYLGF